MRAVKAHLGTSPFETSRETSRRETSRQAGTRQQRGARDAHRHAAATAELPLIDVVVPRAVVCYWHGCPRPATARIGFQSPSLLAGELRDYCPRHTKQVALHPGTAILGRLQLQAPADGAEEATLTVTAAHEQPA